MVDSVYLRYQEHAIKYDLDKKQTKELWNIIGPVCEHEEFKKRMEKPFFHHDDKMLGDHIICDTIVTYKIIKKLRQDKFKGVSLKLACLIAMFHDLYEEPWQNNPVKKKLFNKHGFVHQIEASINAVTWYPEYFKNMDNARIIIDGIIHHMYPFPVRAIDGTEMNLNNQEKFDKLEKKYRDLIVLSTTVGKVGKISLRRSLYPEGRIMSRADKKVSFGLELHSIDGVLALVWGYNKKLLKKEKVDKNKK